MRKGVFGSTGDALPGHTTDCKTMQLSGRVKSNRQYL